MHKRLRLALIIAGTAIGAVGVTVTVGNVLFAWLHRTDRVTRLLDEYYNKTQYSARTAEHRISVEQITRNLGYPWGVGVLPGGREALITEKTTSIVQLVDLTDGSRVEIDRVPGVTPVSARNHCGLLDISLHPRFAENGYVYFAYTTGRRAEVNVRPRISRARFVDNRLIDYEELLTLAAGSANIGTCGMRMTWLADETLLVSVGHAESMSAQDPSELRGKIIRINDDGSIPGDNPFVGLAGEGVRGEIFSLGHRDPQGLVVARDGTIWSVEHGPFGGDELNIIEPGANYGWPVVSYGVAYNFERSKLDVSLQYIGLRERLRDDEIVPVSESREHAPLGFVEPVRYWGTEGSRSIAPSGMLWYSGRMFSEWEGDLLIATLAQRHILRVVVDGGGEVVREEKLLSGQIGRVRHLVEAEDGSILVITDSADGQLLRVSLDE